MSTDREELREALMAFRVEALDDVDLDLLPVVDAYCEQRVQAETRFAFDEGFRAAEIRAAARAWDEGHDAGYSDGAADMLNGVRDAASDHVNPYRAASPAPTPAAARGSDLCDGCSNDADCLYEPHCELHGEHPDGRL